MRRLKCPINCVSPGPASRPAQLVGRQPETALENPPEGFHQPVSPAHAGTERILPGERLSHFDDPILGNSKLGRLAIASFQAVIERASYRERLSPHRALLGPKGVVDRQTDT